MEKTRRARTAGSGWCWHLELTSRGIAACGQPDPVVLHNQGAITSVEGGDVTSHLTNLSPRTDARADRLGMLHDDDRIVLCVKVRLLQAAGHRRHAGG